MLIALNRINKLAIVERLAGYFPSVCARRYVNVSRSEEFTSLTPKAVSNTENSKRDYKVKEMNCFSCYVSTLSAKKCKNIYTYLIALYELVISSNYSLTPENMYFDFPVVF